MNYEIGQFPSWLEAVIIKKWDLFLLSLISFKYCTLLRHILFLRQQRVNIYHKTTMWLYFPCEVLLDFCRCVPAFFSSKTMLFSTVLRCSQKFNYLQEIPPIQVQEILNILQCNYNTCNLSISWSNMFSSLHRAIFSINFLHHFDSCITSTTLDSCTFFNLYFGYTIPRFLKHRWRLQSFPHHITWITYLSITCPSITWPLPKLWLLIPLRLSWRLYRGSPYLGSHLQQQYEVIQQHPPSGILTRLPLLQ